MKGNHIYDVAKCSDNLLATSTEEIVLDSIFDDNGDFNPLIFASIYDSIIYNMEVDINESINKRTV